MLVLTLMLENVYTLISYIVYVAGKKINMATTIMPVMLSRMPASCASRGTTPTVMPRSISPQYSFHLTKDWLPLANPLGSMFVGRVQLCQPCGIGTAANRVPRPLSWPARPEIRIPPRSVGQTRRRYIQALDQTTRIMASTLPFFLLA